MNNSTPHASAANHVNYEEMGIIELRIDELEYRVDAGKQGAALCVSTRAPGSWDWNFHEEVRFDGREVRSKTLERPIRERLGAALRVEAQRFQTD